MARSFKQALVVIRARRSGVVDLLNNTSNLGRCYLNSISEVWSERLLGTRWYKDVSDGLCLESRHHQPLHNRTAVS